MELLFFLLISLSLILLSCIVFSNSVEWLGMRLNLSHGVTGSILAAVGTALPETIVPVVAIFWGVSRDNLFKILTGQISPVGQANEISLGAIIGAPFMLTTLAFCLIGVSSLLYFKTGRRKSKLINVDKTVLERDLTFFIISFSLAFLAIFLERKFHVVLAILLLVLYQVYLYKTIKEEKGSEYKGEDPHENLDKLLLVKFIPSLKPTTFIILLQLSASLIFLVFSAHLFVDVIKEVAHKLSFPAFIISLLLAPLATELPEKFNSWLWIRQKKDTLAVSNISGALVFQSTFPVTVGLLFTSWKVTSLLSYLIFVFCLVNALIILFALKQNKLSYKTFLLCGIFYLVYVILVIKSFL